MFIQIFVIHPKKCERNVYCYKQIYFYSNFDEIEVNHTIVQRYKQKYAQIQTKILIWLWRVIKTLAK